MVKFLPHTLKCLETPSSQRDESKCKTCQWGSWRSVPDADIVRILTALNFTGHQR